MLSKGARARSQDFTGASPLMEAARLGRTDCMKLLLDCNADVNHIDYNGCSILQVAAAANQVTSVKYYWNTKLTLIIKIMMGQQFYTMFHHVVDCNVGTYSTIRKSY